MKKLRTQINKPFIGPTVATLFLLAAALSAFGAWQIASQDEMVKAWRNGNTAMASYQMNYLFSFKNSASTYATQASIN